MYCDVIKTIPVSFVYYKEEYQYVRIDMTEKSTVTIIGDVTGKEAKQAIIKAYPKADRTDVVVRSIKRKNMNFGMSESKFKRLSVPFDPDTGEPLEPIHSVRTRRHYENTKHREFYKIITNDGKRLD